jgi:organic hydroperoxide reductase OsmC/OhrA
MEIDPLLFFEIEVSLLSKRYNMKISARVQNVQGKHEISLQTNDSVQSIIIPPKPSGFGSRANGGELLFLALATCYCNDIYREAGKAGIEVTGVEVTVKGDFGADGEPAANITYNAKVRAKAKESEILDLMKRTDNMVEIQNTLRMGTTVTLKSIKAIST